MDFATCFASAQDLQKKIPNSKICYGLLIPDTSRNTWHKNWQETSSQYFIHYWVEDGRRIYDSGAKQFGYGDYALYPLPKETYIKVGEVINGKLIPMVDDPTIVWASYDGIYTKIYWKDRDRLERNERYLDNKG